MVGVPLCGRSADLTVVGSDLLQSAMVHVLDDGQIGGVRLRLEGSRSGLDDLRSGRADFAVVAFSPDELLPEKEFRLIPLAYQVAIVAVSESNPIRQLSFSQLGGVFGEKEPTNHRQWGTLGGKDVWELKSISPSLVDDSSSLVVDLFKAKVLHSPVFKVTINVFTDADELLRKVRIDDTSIALFSRPVPDERGVHVLLVAQHDDDVAFGPTPENVSTGDYALRLPFYLVFKPERARELKPWIVALLGDPVAAVLSDNGFMPAPRNLRTEAVLLLDER